MAPQPEQPMNVLAELAQISKNLAEVEEGLRTYDIMYAEAVESLERLEASEAPAAVDTIVANLQNQLFEHALLTASEMDGAAKLLERDIEQEIQAEESETEEETK